MIIIYEDNIHKLQNSIAIYYDYELKWQFTGNNWLAVFLFWCDLATVIATYHFPSLTCFVIIIIWIWDTPCNPASNTHKWILSFKMVTASLEVGDQNAVRDYLLINLHLIVSTALVRRVRTTRSSTHSHPFQVSLPNLWTLSHKYSFIPRACKQGQNLVGSIEEVKA